MNILDHIGSRIIGQENTESIRLETEKILKDLLIKKCEVHSKCTDSNIIELVIKFESYEQYVQFLLENDW